MKIWTAIASGVLAALFFALVYGCSNVDRFLGSTEASYEAAGIKGSYRSNKNQQDFKAKLTLDANGKITGLDVSTTAVTPEAAIAAAAAAQAEGLKALADILKVVIPLAEKAALMATPAAPAAALIPGPIPKGSSSTIIPLPAPATTESATKGAVP